MPTAAPLRLAMHAFQTECGVDEVARGCLFGRVYAAAVVWRQCAQLSTTELPPLPKGIVIRDSKTMSRAQRERAAEWIHDNADTVAIAHKDERYIDTHNIRRGAHDAMADAIAHAKSQQPTLVHALIDGDGFAPSFGFRDALVPYTCVVKGDSTFFTIACAAIVAKVAHDQYVRALCTTHPRLDTWYGLCTNVGYGTQTHLHGIRTYGVSPFHRRTFGVCKHATTTQWDNAQRLDNQNGDSEEPTINAATAANSC